MKLTLHINDSSSMKALALISFLEKLDYVTISDQTLDDFELTEEQIKMLEEARNEPEENFISIEQHRAYLKEKYGI